MSTSVVYELNKEGDVIKKRIQSETVPPMDDEQQTNEEHYETKENGNSIPENEKKSETKDDEDEEKKENEGGDEDPNEKTSEHEEPISPNASPSFQNHLDDSEISSVSSFSFRASGNIVPQQVSSSDSEEEEEEISEKKYKDKRETLLDQPEFNENMILDILLVLRTCVLGVSRHLEILDDLPPEVFATIKSFKISRTGNQKRFSCKDFAPVAFYHLRRQNGVSSAEYLQSWTNPRYIQDNSVQQKGSITLCSKDKKYAMRTISQSESKQLRTVLHDYYEYVTSQPNTLLTKYLGHHRITIKGKKVYLLIYLNSFHSPMKLHESYQLKGMQLSRGSSTRNLDKSKKETSLSDSFLRENEFLEKRKNICIPEYIRKHLLTQIQDDCNWLEQHSFIGYNFSLGIHNKSQETASEKQALRNKQETSLRKIPSCVFFLEETKESFGKKGRKARKSDKTTIPRKKRLSIFEAHYGGLESASIEGETEIYFVSITDFLNKYNTRKKMASIARSTLRYSLEQQSLNPSLYNQRFQEFLRKVIVSNSSDSPTEADEPFPIVSTPFQDIDVDGIPSSPFPKKSAIKKSKEFKMPAPQELPEIPIDPETPDFESMIFSKVRRDSLDLARASLRREGEEDDPDDDEDE